MHCIRQSWQDRAAPEILSVSNLTDRRSRNVSFALHKGEILGFAGLIGAGRSEIARGITRLEGNPAAKCGLTVNVLLRDYADCIAKGIVYLSEDRKGDGVFLDLSIAANVAALDLSRIAGRCGVIDRQRETEQAQRIGASLRLKAASMAHRVASLSGGNQQKVALAKQLAVEPKVIFLDEPTRGVDVGAKAEIHAILRSLADQGVGVAVISSEMPELIGLCDRVLFVSEGRISGELSGPDLTETNIMTLAAPGAMALSGHFNEHDSQRPQPHVAPIRCPGNRPGSDHPDALCHHVLRQPAFPDLDEHACHDDGLLGRGDRRRRHDHPAHLGGIDLSVGSVTALAMVIGGPSVPQRL